MNYERRIVAFIDILGFKAQISGTVDKDTGEDVPANIDKLAEAFLAIREIWDLDKPPVDWVTSGRHAMVTTFSDSVAISVLETEESGLYYMLQDLKSLIMQLIRRGIICRGAVTRGKFIHTDQYLFGPAFNEAYLLESKAALYPRIILDQNIVDAGAKSHSHQHSQRQERTHIEDLLEEDSDGMFYIDYFAKAKDDLDDATYDFSDYINNLGALIRKGIADAAHTSKADLRVKYYWMRERYNRMVARVTAPDGIRALDESGEPDLADFYRNLKGIEK